MNLPEWLVKARDEKKDPSLHFRPECEGYRCGAHKSYNEGFEACFEIMMAERDALRTALAKIADYKTLDGEKYNSYQDGWHGVANFAKQTLEKTYQAGN